MADGIASLLVTGGIGSGKSHIVRAFEVMGIPSYDCDSRAKALYDTAPGLMDRVVAIAGPQVLGSDGRLDRRSLASAIFRDRDKLSELEAALYPALRRDFLDWKKSQDSPFVVIESAVLLEKDSLADLPDFVLAVNCPADIRVMRVMERDGCSRNDVEARMGMQWDDSRRSAAADWTIMNDGRGEILPQLIEIAETVKRYPDGKNRS